MGIAHLKRPLPISMVAESCAFRPVVLQAFREKNLEWRTVFESGNIEATTATVRSDLSVTAWLASTVPSDLDILGLDTDLPTLPDFAISLHLPSNSGPAAENSLSIFVMACCDGPEPAARQQHSKHLGDWGDSCSFQAGRGKWQTRENARENRVHRSAHVVGRIVSIGTAQLPLTRDNSNRSLKFP